VANELTAIGMPAGPKFDAVVNQVFAMQLTGRGKDAGGTHKDFAKTFSGIKEQPKPKESKGKEKKPGKGVSKAQLERVSWKQGLRRPAAKAAAAPAKGQKPVAAKKAGKEKEEIIAGGNSLCLFEKRQIAPCISGQRAI